MFLEKMNYWLTPEKKCKWKRVLYNVISSNNNFSIALVMVGLRELGGTLAYICSLFDEKTVYCPGNMNPSSQKLCELLRMCSQHLTFRSWKKARPVLSSWETLDEE